ncbi:hypothetical protein WA026_003381 [Henosepilachna vigintioctopunctata]|uniref:Farnesol dehydrogenase-like n=1 Tax=Henosepilachna vigintioctopunctata TaxID=420089 RepID=A0AAW1THF6_9CUCU
MENSLAKWNGKVAVVTGASNGIGAEIAERLVENGMKVIGLARRVEVIERNAEKLVCKKGELHGIKVDMRNSQGVLEAFEIIEKKFGPINILVNNAGMGTNTTLSDGDIEKWKEVFDTNVIGLCVATKAAVTSMKKNNIDGHIIHINSVVGHKVPAGIELNVLPASKYAVTALTESLRLELLHRGSKIKITSISPGLVDTGFLATADMDVPPEGSPILRPRDVADAAIYVLSTPSHVQVNELTITPVGSRL